MISGRATDDRAQDESAIGDDGDADENSDGQQPEVAAGDRGERNDVVETHRRVGEHDDGRGGDEVARGSGAPDDADVAFVRLRPHVERDDDEHPCADEFDQWHAEQGVGEEKHEEPERDCADRAEDDRATRVFGRQPAAREGDDDRIVRAEQQVDEENLQQEEEPTGGVGHVRPSTGSDPPDSGSLVRATRVSSIRQPQGFWLSGDCA